MKAHKGSMRAGIAFDRPCSSLPRPLLELGNTWLGINLELIVNDARGRMGSLNTTRPCSFSRRGMIPTFTSGAV